MYDYYLGGKDNYPADRQAAERIIGMMPAGVVRTAALQNRKFLIRAVLGISGRNARSPDVMAPILSPAGHGVSQYVCLAPGRRARMGFRVGG